MSSNKSMIKCRECHNEWMRSNSKHLYSCSLAACTPQTHCWRCTSLHDITLLLQQARCALLTCKFDAGVLTNDAQLPFSYVLQPEQQPELASTTCTAVSLVQCEGQSFSGWSKPVPLAAESISGRGTVSSPEGSKFDAVKSCLEAFAVKGCVEHGRLWGILE